MGVWTILLPALLIPALIITLILLVRLALKLKSRQAGVEMNEACQGNLKHVSNCGVVTAWSRVPGVIGICHDRIVYQAFIRGARGVIFFPKSGTGRSSPPAGPAIDAPGNTSAPRSWTS